MEFFKIICPGKGNVFIDGSFQGLSLDGSEPRVFQCNTGTHDIRMDCLDGKQCQKPVQRVRVEHTNPIQPMEVIFICA